MNLNYFTEKFQGKYALSKALRSIFKSNKLMLKEFEIHFWDLPDSIRFILKNELRYALFDKAAKKDLVFLSKNLGISYSYLCHLRRGSFSIDKKNLLNYFHKIGFTNREKKLKLEKIIERGARHSKKEMLNLNRSILNLLISKNLATSKIAEMLNLPIQKVLKRLTALEKKEVIEKIGRVSANRSYIWKINEVMNL